MAEGGGGSTSASGQSGTVKSVNETAGDFRDGSEDIGGVSLTEFCAQLDDCTPTVRSCSLVGYKRNWLIPWSLLLTIYKIQNNEIVKSAYYVLKSPHCTGVFLCYHFTP